MKNKASGHISHNTSVFLNNADPVDKAAFMEIFNAVRLSVNKQKELVEWVSDIARRDDIAASEVFRLAGTHEILADTRKNGPQKAFAIRDRIYEKRFPQVCAYRRELKRLIARLKLPDTVRLVPVSPLEDREYRLEIAFDSHEKLMAALEALVRLSGSDEFKEFSTFLKSGIAPQL